MTNLCTKFHLKIAVYDLHNLAENYSTRPKLKLNLRILLTHLYTKFQLKMSICNGDWNFSKSKGHNLAENYSTQPKLKLNLRILLTHLYTEFQLKMSICNGDDVRKLKINGIFLSPRGITQPKII